MRKHLILFVILAALAALPITAYAAPPAAPGSQRDSEVRAYWTADRMAHATPRDYVLDDHGHVERVPAGKPSGPGGGGGSSTTTGASWTASTPPMAWATGRVYFTMSGVNYTCSGSIVDPGPNPARLVVLSAGHCVLDEGNDQFATNWMFIPNYDSGNASFGSCATAPTRCWVANALVASAGWRDGTAANPNFASDYGFAIFTNSNALLGYSQNPNGYPLASSFPVAPTSVDAFGYPAEGKYNGTDLVYCAGPTVQDPYSTSTNWGLPCNMNGGASGGGWFSNFGTNAQALVSLNSYTYRGLKGYMFGPLFTPATTATYQAALSASGDTVYPAP